METVSSFKGACKKLITSRKSKKKVRRQKYQWKSSKRASEKNKDVKNVVKILRFKNSFEKYRQTDLETVTSFKGACKKLKTSIKSSKKVRCQKYQ